MVPNAELAGLDRHQTPRRWERMGAVGLVGSRVWLFESCLWSSSVRLPGRAGFAERIKASVVAAS